VPHSSQRTNRESNTTNHNHQSTNSPDGDSTTTNNYPGSDDNDGAALLVFVTCEAGAVADRKIYKNNTKQIGKKNMRWNELFRSKHSHMLLHSQT
jgi:hypothetical protein